MMLYTKLLADKSFLYDNYKGYKLKKEIKKYKNKLKETLQNALKENEFIIKFDELYELYILVENYNDCKKRRIYIIENEDPDVLSFYCIIKNIIEFRIDLDPTRRNFRVICKEIQIGYSIDYVFHLNVKFTDYNDDSKDKDKQLMQFINTLLYEEYLTCLNIAMDSNEPLKDKIGCENLNESYSDKKKLDYRGI